jgi:hypothetical protein
MPEWYVLLGYAGSLLIAISMSMRNIIKLRWINLAGAGTFAFYGYIISAFPVILLNSYIFLIDIYYLFKIHRSKDCFSLVPVLDNNHIYLNKFIEYYKFDIQKFFPNFSKDNLNDPKYFFILRNLVPSGLFVYEKIENNVIEVKLDYAIPNFRDYKNAKFIYHAESAFLKEIGINKIVNRSNVKVHQKYLRSIGFKSSELDKNYFYKFIN